MKDKKDYYFFWGGEFSNWEHSPFTTAGREFNCGEQFMMFTKAMFFRDTEIAEQIMQEPNPWTQKQLGKKVRNYVDEEWDRVRYPLVKAGLIEKFRQNPNMKKELFKRRNKIIVEASPEDRIWGIGYSSRDAMNYTDNWGTNLLGKMMNDIANELYTKAEKVKEIEDGIYIEKDE